MPLNLFNVVLAETWNVCTRQCWFCKFGQERADSARVQMSWEMIHSLLKNLSRLDYAGRLSWFHINEPLADKRMCEIIRASRVACPKALLHLNSNGDLLTPELWEALVASGLDAMGVSVYDDETLDRVRQLQDPKRLVIIDMRRPENKIENRGGSIKTRRHVFAGRLFAVQNRSCGRPFNMLVIRPNGDVALCCADMYGDVKMGNLATQNLEAIWFDRRFVQYRESLQARGRRGLPLCENCSHDGSTSSVTYPFDDIQPGSPSAATHVRVSNAIAMGLGQSTTSRGSERPKPS